MFKKIILSALLITTFTLGLTGCFINIDSDSLPSYDSTINTEKFNDYMRHHVWMEQTKTVPHPIFSEYYYWNSYNVNSDSTINIIHHFTKKNEYDTSYPKFSVTVNYSYFVPVATGKKFKVKLVNPSLTSHSDNTSNYIPANILRHLLKEETLEKEFYFYQNTQTPTQFKIGRDIYEY